MAKSSEQIAEEIERKQWWMEFTIQRKQREMEDRIALENNRAVRKQQESDKRANKGK